MKIIKLFTFLVTLYAHVILCIDQKPFALFAHGIGATRKQADLLYIKNSANKHFLVDPEQYDTVSFDFKDALNDNGGLNFKREHVNFGQQSDIDQVNAAYATIKKDVPVVAVGLSRGASTLLSCEDLDSKVMVLESPFDSVVSIAQAILARGRIPSNSYTLRMFLSLFGSYFPALDVKGICPHQTIHKFPLNVPVLFVHGKDDKVVPVTSSRRLYKVLVERGHKDAYLLELEQGAHGKLMKGNDAQLYQDVVHAFYKKYGLPCNEEFAQRGMDILLNKCQPRVS